MPRRPGDISPINNFITGYTKINQGGQYTSTTTNSAAIFRSQRASYAYGVRGKIGSKVWIYPTPYSHYSRTIQQGPKSRYEMKYTYGGVGYKEVTAPDIDTMLSARAGYSWSSISSVEKYNVQSAAQVKALNKIGDAKADIGGNLAQFMQIVHMFKGKTSLLYELLNAMKKGKLGKYLNQSAQDIAKNGDKKAAQAYLEYVYGWKPLVSDIYGTYKLLQEYASGMKPLIIHGRGHQTQGTTWAWNSPSSTLSLGYFCNMMVKEDFKGTCDLYGRVDPQYLAFRVLNQLGLSNPAAIVWEVTPWSFVVDWLIPIGPVLSAFTAPIGVDFISGTTACRVSRSFEGEYHTYMSGSPPATVIKDEPCRFTAQDELYARVTHSTWPFPKPYLNLNPLSGDRSYKALALAIAKLR